MQIITDIIEATNPEEMTMNSPDPGMTLIIKSGSIQAATQYAADRGIYAQGMDLHKEWAEVVARVRKAYLDAACNWFNEPAPLSGEMPFGTLLFYSVDDTREEGKR